jgi:hypothetical protein
LSAIIERTITDFRRCWKVLPDCRAHMLVQLNTMHGQLVLQEPLSKLFIRGNVLEHPLLEVIDRPYAFLPCLRGRVDNATLETQMQHVYLNTYSLKVLTFALTDDTKPCLLSINGLVLGLELLTNKLDPTIEAW